MARILQTLPIVERWDCHRCTACCRETTILLDHDDLARLERQQWDEHPDFRGVPTVRRLSWSSGQRVLAHRPDGSCVFLSDAGLCRIHEKFGSEAKPLMCRQFPLVVVASNRGRVATVVRSCPSAAADRGRPLSEQLSSLRHLLDDNLPRAARPNAPPIVRRVARGWDDFQTLADSLERLLADRRYPLVRRLVHGLRFCALVEQCKWKRIESAAVAELAKVLEQSAPAGVGDSFQDRQPPSQAAARLFRRLGAHFIRCVPGGRPIRSWRDRWRMFRLSGKLARSRREFPELHPRFPAVESSMLERPLGPLADDVRLPLERYIETQAVSRRFVLSRPGTSLVKSYRALAVTFPMALWMLRWITAERSPTADDTVQIVVALERGYVLSTLDRAAGYFVDAGQLERLIAWYGR